MINNIEFINDAYTKDGLKLPMVHFSSDKKDICVIFVHGMCGTIIDNYFATVWGSLLQQNNIGFIYEHNRGHSIENDIVMKDGTYKRCGCMYEIFEDCIYDIDLAIEVAKSKGYQKIVLLGHSYGCNKVIYYLNNTKNKIEKIILASAPDMIGPHIEVQSDHEDLLVEAKKNINNNKKEKLLHKKIEDYMYMSSNTYYNWYHKNSNVDNLPILGYSNNWNQFESINIPILTFSGLLEEESYLQLELLKEHANNCPCFEFKYVEGANHTYQQREEETGKLILQFLKRKN